MSELEKLNAMFGIDKCEILEEALRIICNEKAKEAVEMDKFLKGFSYKPAISAERIAINFFSTYIRMAKNKLKEKE